MNRPLKLLLGVALMLLLATDMLLIILSQDTSLVIADLVLIVILAVAWLGVKRARGESTEIPSRYPRRVIFVVVFATAAVIFLLYSTLALRLSLAVAFIISLLGASLAAYVSLWGLPKR